MCGKGIYFEDVFSRVKEDMGIEITYESTPLEDAANKIMVMATSNSCRIL